MARYVHPARLPGHLLIVGFGAIGRGVLPLLLRHLDAVAEQILIIEPSALNDEVDAHF